MSLLFRTIKSYPKGKLSEELIYLLDKDCDSHQRLSILSELVELEKQELIFRDKSGRWRCKVPCAQDAAHDLIQSETDFIEAVPGHFEDLEKPQNEVDVSCSSGDFSIKQLLGYFKVAVRADSRGALSAIPESHGTKWQLVTGGLPHFLVEAEIQFVRLSLKLENLPGTFRQAILRREESDKSITLGWPMCTGIDRSAPKVWPIGLFSGQYQRTETELLIDFDLQNLFVNPLWTRENFRTFGWNQKQFQDLFQIGSATPLSITEFIEKLREAVAGHYSGALSARSLKTGIDPSVHKVWDAFGVFLNDDNTFNKGIIDDYKAFDDLDETAFQNTALSDFIFGSKIADTFIPALNVGPTNSDQIEAVQSALSSSVSVITGPPGTGKSQTIASIATSVLLNGGSVLFASKNHQALDAVVDRLSNLAPDVDYSVRTYDRSGDIDVSFKDILNVIAKKPNKNLQDFDVKLKSKLSTMASARSKALLSEEKLNATECEIANLLYRIKLRESGQFQSMEETNRLTSQKSLLQRILSLAFFINKKNRDDRDLAKKAADLDAPLSVLYAQLEALRDVKNQQNIDIDILKITEEISELTEHLLTPFLKSQSAISDETLKELLEENDVNILLDSRSEVTPNIALKLLKSRPLWLSSVQAASKRIPLIPGLFDLLVIDEATQCDLASAIPIMFRAKQVVIVGDDKQLKFIPNIGKAQDLNFMRLNDLEPSKAARFSQSSLSLFDAALRVPKVQKTLLRSQYRSAPEIVDYISSQFYGGELKVAVDYNSLKSPPNQKPGIAWTDVKPNVELRNDHVNSAEISAVIAHLEKLLIGQGYDGTVGFVTPFRAQVLAFETEVVKSIPTDVLEKVRLKAGTVDSFQGDERDLVIFSPTLTNNSTSSAVNFVRKDFRRLNVAISRARAVAHVFGDLDYARSNVVRSLGKLAEFATKTRKKPSGENVFDSEWERQVYYALKKRGLDPIPQYEIAGRRLDFALFGLGDIKIDVEVDGRRWHTDIDGNRKVSDIWRNRQLESLGWKVMRFWVDELDRDMEKCIDLIEQQLT